jgi:hypothetical protein
MTLLKMIFLEIVKNGQLFEPLAFVRSIYNYPKITFFFLFFFQGSKTNPPPPLQNDFLRVTFHVFLFYAVIIIIEYNLFNTI